MTTANAQTTTEAPPATRVLWCQVCRRYTAHKWHGLQVFPTKTFDLYNCSHCGDTAAEEAS